MPQSAAGKIEYRKCPVSNMQTAATTREARNRIPNIVSQRFRVTKILSGCFIACGLSVERAPIATNVGNNKVASVDHFSRVDEPTRLLFIPLFCRVLLGRDPGRSEKTIVPSILSSGSAIASTASPNGIRIHEPSICCSSPNRNKTTIKAVVRRYVQFANPTLQ